MFDAMTAALVQVNTEEGRKNISMASAFFSYDAGNLASDEVRELVDFSKRKKFKLILGPNASSRQEIWGSTYTRD